MVAELTLTQVIGAIGTAVSAVSAVSQGIQQGRMNRYQAAVDEQRAQRERERAELDASEFERRQSDLMAKRRAELGGSGVEPGTGSPLLVSQDFAAETEFQKLMIMAGGEDRATRLEQEAGLYRKSAKNARTAGFVRGGSLLVQGLGESGAFDNVKVFG